MCVTLQVYLIKWCTGPDSIHRIPSTDLPSTENTTNNNNNNNNNNNLNEIVVTPPTNNNTTPPSTCWKKMVVCCKSKETREVVCRGSEYMLSNDNLILGFSIVCDGGGLFIF
jgi:hypothetical protein